MTINKLYLGARDIKQVAAELGATPIRLLRAAAWNWELGPAGANHARQLILDAANAAGPGMASKGERALSLLKLLLIPTPTEWPCSRCGAMHSHPTSDYCSPCRSGD